MYYKSLIFLLILGFAGPSQANVYLEFAIEAGGDTFSSTRQEDLNAGGGYKLALGLKQTIGGFGDVGIVASLGFLFDFIEASNGDAEIGATVLDLAYFRDLGPHRLSVGGSYHLNPRYEDDLDGLPRTRVDFDDALGVFVRYGFLFVNEEAGAQAEIGIRYTAMDYEFGGRRFDAGGFGLFIADSF